MDLEAVHHKVDGISGTSGGPFSPKRGPIQPTDSGLPPFVHATVPFALNPKPSRSRWVAQKGRSGAQGQRLQRSAT